jgi:predicted nucleic acid-binding protein
MAGTEPTIRVVVCDAGPLIHLDEVGSIDLLSDFVQVLVPPTVLDEVNRHRPAALRRVGVNFQNTSPTQPMSAELATVGRLFALHPGELEALQLATEQGVDLLLTDDTSARLAARHFSVPVHGTIGILIRSIRRGQRTQSQIVDTLHLLSSASTLHLKQSFLDEVVQEVMKLK